MLIGSRNWIKVNWHNIMVPKCSLVHLEYVKIHIYHRRLSWTITPKNASNLTDHNNGTRKYVLLGADIKKSHLVRLLLLAIYLVTMTGIVLNDLDLGVTLTFGTFVLKNREKWMRVKWHSSCPHKTSASVVFVIYFRRKLPQKQWRTLGVHKDYNCKRNRDARPGLTGNLLKWGIFSSSQPQQGDTFL